MTVGYTAILTLIAATIVIGYAYFRRWTLTRPPLGTVNLGDVTFIVVSIIIVPYLYIGLPEVLVGALLALSTLSALYFLLEPALPKPAVWTISLGLVAANIALAIWGDTTDVAFLLLNDLVIILLVASVTNIWAQGGLRARDLAILAGAIAIYDLIATGLLPLTTELIERLAGLPFVPMLAWPVGDDRWIGIGLGDLLMATLGPLVLRKAYGRTAGLAAIGIAMAGIAGVMLTATRWDALPETFPSMIVLGPLMLAQYLWWQRRNREERTTVQYLIDEPMAVGHSATAPEAATR